MTRRPLLVACCFLRVASTTLGGDLNPPPGPIAPTHKTLTEVEPRTVINATNTPGDADSLYRITKGGSYYLAERILGVTGKHGIKVMNDGVTIDLNGFSVIGVTGALSGIRVEIPYTETTIRNGTIRLWPGAGISADFNFGLDVEEIRVLNNGSVGMSVGSQARVVNCGASGNTTGINTLGGALVRNCVGSQNSQDGIRVGESSTVEGCIVEANNGFGILLGPRGKAKGCTTTSNNVGIDGAVACSAVECTASTNAQFGIRMQRGSSILACAASETNGLVGGAGISTAEGCTIVDCTASDNGLFSTGVYHGIIAGAGSTMRGCTTYRNGSGTGGGYGIASGGSCTIVNCTANSNGSGSATINDGILAGAGDSITGCVANSNRGDGIELAQGCHVTGNQCQSNGNGGNGAGIHALAAANHIEGNTVIANTRGIDVDSAGNVIVRNFARSNTTNWDVVAGNVCLVVSATASGAIFGSSGGAAPGSTDPNANFSY